MVEIWLKTSWFSFASMNCNARFDNLERSPPRAKSCMSIQKRFHQWLESPESINPNIPTISWLVSTESQSSEKWINPSSNPSGRLESLDSSFPGNGLSSAKGTLRSHRINVSPALTLFAYLERCVLASWILTLTMDFVYSSNILSQQAFAVHCPQLITSHENHYRYFRPHAHPTRSGKRKTKMLPSRHHSWSHRCLLEPKHPNIGPQPILGFM